MYIYLNNWQQWLAFIWFHLVPCFALGMIVNEIIVKKLTPRKIFNAIVTRIRNRKEIKLDKKAKKIAKKVKKNPELLEKITLVLEQNIES